MKRQNGSPPAELYARPLTESTRYLGETAFGTVEKVCAVCTVVNSKIVDPKKIEKIYSYIQEMFGPEALDYEHAFLPKEPTEKLLSLTQEERHLPRSPSRRGLVE